MSDQSSKESREAKPTARAPADVPKKQLEIIPPALDTALRTAGIDTGDPNVFRALEISLTMMFSGSLPLPPPLILKEYESVHPGLVAKFVEWTEQQSAHRKTLEKTKTDRSENRLDRGQVIAACVALGGLVLASVEGIWGNAWVAAIIAIVSVGGPTAAIWFARNIGNHSQKQPSKSSSSAPPARS
jgi:uncharacterized membrane protein